MKLNGLDETDNRIVGLLMRNARMSWSDIGEEVGLTRVAVKNRVRALEEKGVIRGYHAPPPSPIESKRLFYTSVSLLLSRIQGYHYHLSKFHIYALVYCIGVFLSGLLHSV